MKGIEIIDISSLDLKSAFLNENIFILRDRRQRRAHHPNEMELRCSCVPLRTMSGEALREMFENLHEYRAIKIDPEGEECNE